MSPQSPPLFQLKLGNGRCHRYCYRHCIVTLLLLLSLSRGPFNLPGVSGSPPLPPTWQQTIDCSLSFTNFDDRFLAWERTGDPFPGSSHPTNYWVYRLINYQPIAAHCPPDCLVNATTSPLVYGSFPYHGTSSLCLSAIHAGLINSTLGGGVFVSRFWRFDWSATVNQTIFPFTSSNGSLSNGVLSRDVASTWYSVPSNRQEWSYSLRGRGDFVVQRREAPFPVRAGHLHLMWTLSPDSPYLSNPLNRTYAIHIIIGGHNATHYLMQQPVYEDIEWRRLREAPFSPRAFMQARWWSPTSGPEDVNLVRIRRYPYLNIIGGQTGHMCGLRELGVCEGDIWQVNITRTGTDEEPVWDLSWGQKSIALLPFTPRCEPGVFVWSNPQRPDTLQPNWLDTYLVMGGQLSYTDSGCSSPPISVNEIWAVQISLTTLSLSKWVELAAATWSPRRFAVNNNPSTPANGDHESSMCLYGGIRHLSIKRADDGFAVLTGSEVSAEVWCCEQRFHWPAENDFDSLVVWLSASTDKLWSTASLAVAAAGGSGRAALYTNGPMLGGFSPKAALQQWSLTRVGGDEGIPVEWSLVAVNATHVLSVGESGAGWYNWSMLMVDRLQLPLSVRMDTAELADEEGEYALGSSWVHGFVREWVQQASIPRAGGMYASIHLFGDEAWATLHYQPYAFVTHPANSTFFVPVAASSLNTSRPNLNFRLRRLGAAAYDDTRMFIKLTDINNGSFPPPEGLPVSNSVTYTSGGRSGSVYNADWLITYSVRCLAPNDPSYAGALGPVEFGPYSSNPYYQALFSGGSFPAMMQVWLTCRGGYHFEPPSPSEDVEVQCMPNGMWAGQRQTLNRCVRNNLNCNWPLQDLGGPFCEPAAPLIQSIQASYELPDGSTHFVPSTNPVTLVNLPYLPNIQLTVRGNIFMQPLLIQTRDPFLNVQCTNPHLLEVARGNVCYNITQRRNDLNEVTTVCTDYGSAFVCALPALRAVHLGLEVFSGLLAERARLNVSGRQMDEDVEVNSVAPVLQILSSPDCQDQPNSPLHLFGCPVNRPFDLTVCVADWSIGNDDDRWQEVTVRGGREGSGQLLDCSSLGWQAEEEGIQCIDCTVRPSLGFATVRVSSVVRNNAVASGFLLPRNVQIVSQTDATLSFASCYAGSIINITKLSRLEDNLCSPCALGASSQNTPADAVQCTPCSPGSYTNTTGMTVCLGCPPGHLSSQPGAITCDECPVNSFSGSWGSSACQQCELNTYIVYSGNDHIHGRELGNNRVDGQCVACPAQAECNRQGVITARAGSYLLIDQQAGTVHSTPCSALACVTMTWDVESNSTLNLTVTPSNNTASWDPQVVSRSGLSVVNTCDAGRWPAHMADSRLYADELLLQETSGHNVLCSLCLPGHSSVLGRCILCTSPQVGPLFLVLLLLFLMVFMVHRLPHDWTGSATLPIVSYFLQQSVLFLSGEDMPQLMGLFNLNLVGDSTVSGEGEYSRDSGMWVNSAGFCVVPLDDPNRIVLALLSPLIAFVMLAIVGILHCCAEQLMHHCNRPSSSIWTTLYLVVFPQSAPGERDGLTDRSEFTNATAPADVPSFVDIQPLLSGSLDPQPMDSAKTDAWHRRRQLILPPSDSNGAEEPLDQSYQPLRPDEVALWPWQRLTYQRTCVRLMQLSYSAVAVLCLSFFHHQSVGEFGWRLVRFPSISPSSDAYRQLLPVIVTVLMLFVVGLPLALGSFLAWEHRKGGVAAVKQLQLVGVIPAFSAPLLSSGGVNGRRRRNDLLLVLTSMYRPSYIWLMPVFNIIRRLLVAVVLVVVDDSSVWMWMTTLNYVLLAIHARFQPYEREGDNWLEMLTLLSLCLQTTLLSVWPPPFMTVSLLAVLSILQLAPLVPAAVLWIRRNVGRCQVRKSNIEIEEAEQSPMMCNDDDTTAGL